MTKHHLFWFQKVSFSLLLRFDWPISLPLRPLRCWFRLIELGFLSITLRSRRLLSFCLLVWCFFLWLLQWTCLATWLPACMTPRFTSLELWIFLLSTMVAQELIIIRDALVHFIQQSIGWKALTAWCILICIRPKFTVTCAPFKEVDDPSEQNGCTLINWKEIYWRQLLLVVI